jgi:hypothetical protein
LDNIKIKPLTKEQLIISIDRLTRFKRGKYLRVFCDILTSNLISPKYKKYEIEDMEPEKLRDLAQYVINFSLENLGYVCDGDFSLNKKILDYENSVFELDNDTKILIDNKIDYKSFINLIGDNSVKNLRWLKVFATEKDMKKARVEYSLGFPVKEVIIVEGATEEILLPEFAKICGYDFDKEGIYVISAGGKNQVVKMYYKLIEELKIPIFILLDKDAEENINQIKPKLRKIDKIHLVSCGEFEDLLPGSLIVKTVNNELNNFAAITEDDLDNDCSAVENLENIFKTKGFHEFKKADFAKLVKDNITEDSDISAEIASIIMEIGL